MPAPTAEGHSCSLQRLQGVPVVFLAKISDGLVPHPPGPQFVTPSPLAETPRRADPRSAGAADA
jgi:hypothetical protein